MALLNQSVQVPAQIGKFFEAVRQGQAPTKFTREYLKDIGFKSSNHLAFIPLLKGLKFLTDDGSPTQRYRDFLDSTKSSAIIAEAIKEAYGDIFTIKAKPSKADKAAISGKYKSTFNASDLSAERSASTFLALLDLADSNTLYDSKPPPIEKPDFQHTPVPIVEKHHIKAEKSTALGLHYNIQIHLPATKDIEVYNAIFKSIREHLID